MKKSSAVLETAVKSVVPIKILMFNARLTGWVKLTGNITKDFTEHQTRTRRQILESLQTVAIGSPEWTDLICGTKPEYGWAMGMNVTDTLQVVVRSPGSHNATGECNPDAYMTEGSFYWLSATQRVDTLNGTLVWRNEKIVGVRQQVRTPELSALYQKMFNINAIDSPERDVFVVRIRRPRESQQYEVTLPLHVDASIVAKVESKETNIQRRWDLELDPVPMSNPTLGFVAYVYYAAHKKKPKQIPLYVNE